MSPVHTDLLEYTRVAVGRDQGRLSGRPAEERGRRGAGRSPGPRCAKRPR
ncbi:MAG: hypothetical protein MZV70_28775 [Desulfobacterales bacterium]|nr:hypothetical protein [Desulfobacterales bacterium]